MNAAQATPSAGLATVSDGPPSRGLRIAYIGQRGLPATYGGIERHVEEIGARLAERGHEITVFCRADYSPDRASSYRGMRLRQLPTVHTKHFEAVVHSGIASIRSLKDDFDIIHYQAIGPGLVAPVPRAFSDAKVVLTVHGLDHQRAKWGRAARYVLTSAAWMSARAPHATVVVSSALARHYRDVYDRDTVLIANGVTATDRRAPGAFSRQLGLTPGRYVLFVGRLVPEKAPDALIRAFRNVQADVKLVIAGGSSHTDDFVAVLRSLASADPRVVLAEYVYGQRLAELYSNARAFVLPSSLEGMPLTLLEAASYGLPTVVSDIAPHLEVVGGTVPESWVFPSGDEASLTAALESVIARPQASRQFGARLRNDVVARYSWDAAAAATEKLYWELLPESISSRVAI
jgi:glycosyltransferase involved in cell wall biosynthesis